MERDKPQARTLHKHREEWEGDLNPDAMEGQNIGLPQTEPYQHAPSVEELKKVHAQLAGFSEKDLKRIRVLPQGTRLQQGATYIDLQHMERGEFSARGDMQAEADNWYVAKEDVPFELWNRLIGVKNPVRTGKE